MEEWTECVLPAFAPPSGACMRAWTRFSLYFVAHDCGPRFSKIAVALEKLVEGHIASAAPVAAAAAAALHCPSVNAAALPQAAAAVPQAAAAVVVSSDIGEDDAEEGEASEGGGGRGFGGRGFGGRIERFGELRFEGCGAQDQARARR